MLYVPTFTPWQHPLLLLPLPLSVSLCFPLLPPHRQWNTLKHKTLPYYSTSLSDPKASTLCSFYSLFLCLIVAFFLCITLYICHILLIIYSLLVNYWPLTIRDEPAFLRHEARLRRNPQEREIYLMESSKNCSASCVHLGVDIKAS